MSCVPHEFKEVLFPWAHVFNSIVMMVVFNKSSKEMRPSDPCANQDPVAD